MKVIDYALVIYVAIITILGAVFIYLNQKSNVFLSTKEVTGNIIGVAMIFIGLGIMIIAVILTERREKSLTEELELKEKVCLFESGF